MNFRDWQPKFELFVTAQLAEDPAHDLAHVQRVVSNAVRFARELDAVMEVVFPAAWLHDCVVIPKDSPQRPYASQLAAEAAVAFLHEQNYPQRYLDEIGHAIMAHSFSANIPAKTLEAKIVQDADRIDALGAIGIARCFAMGGMLARPLYQLPDPFCEDREPDDLLATVDHFYTKLLRLAGTMQTKAGKREAEKRSQFMLGYLARLKEEIIVEL